MGLPPFGGNVTDYVDYVSTVLRQCNSCPICHLPLVYCHPERDASSDMYWLQIQGIMRSTYNDRTSSLNFDPRNNIPNSTYMYGTAPDVTNGERCHYVAATYFPLFSTPLLLQVPSHYRVLHPEPGVYLFPEEPRVESQHRVFRYNMRRLLPDGIPKHRMARLENMLSLNGVRFFLACKDCNRNHTSDSQVNFMVNKIYPDSGRGGTNPPHPNNCNMYTLMFDSLAEYTAGKTAIVFTRRRRLTWQLEVWLTYCTILFVAQHVKEANNAKYARQSMAYHSFHFGHRDMGICDFYMSQILCALMYVKYDIDIDFITLHQRFMVHIPLWAEQSGLFITPKKSFRCLWKMVMGEYGRGSLTPIITDPSTMPDREHYRTGSPDCYWKVVGNVQAFASLVVDKITNFENRWLKVIGALVDARSGPDPNTILFWELEHHYNDISFLLNLRRMYFNRCGKDVIQNLKRLPFLDVPPADRVINTYTRKPSLDNLKHIFIQHMNTLPPQLFENLIAVAMQRMQAGYFLAVNSREAETVDELTAKYNVVCYLLGQLLA